MAVHLATHQIVTDIQTEGSIRMIYLMIYYIGFMWSFHKHFTNIFTVNITLLTPLSELHLSPAPE